MTKAEGVQGRREVRYETMQDIANDLDELAAGGEPRSLGNWTAAQNVEHVAKFFEFAREGYPDIGFPTPLRWFIGTFAKKRYLARGFQPGFKFPTKKVAAAFGPGDMTWAEAVSYFREQIERSRQPGVMTSVNPILGKMTHEEYVQLQCRHAELHFSFLVPA